MQPSNQQPSETDKQQAGSIPGEEMLGSGEVAFYEFPAEVPAQQAEPAPTASSSIPQEKISPVEVSEHDIQSGLVYPPPPSFYQNMQVPAEKPPLPSPVPSAPFPPAANQPYPGMPFRPTYAGTMPRTQVPGSRKKYWIILSILSAALLLSCGLCSWWTYAALNPVVQDVTSVMSLATRYYQDIEQKEYEAAYNCVQIDSMSQEIFIGQAQQRDSELGPVSSFQIAAPSPQISNQDDSARISFYSVTVSVVRGTSESYSAHLNLQKIENNWRITSFDLI